MRHIAVSNTDAFTHSTPFLAIYPHIYWGHMRGCCLDLTPKEQHRGDSGPSSLA
jgi:hypothetical protein